MIDCPTCHGEGVLRTIIQKHPLITCHFCNGFKVVPDIHLLWIKQGRELNVRRIQKRLTLRSAAKLLRIDASHLSDMEIGKKQPNMDITYERMKIIKSEELDAEYKGLNCEILK